MKPTFKKRVMLFFGLFAHFIIFAQISSTAFLSLKGNKTALKESIIKAPKTVVLAKVNEAFYSNSLKICASKIMDAFDTFSRMPSSIVPTL